MTSEYSKITNAVYSYSTSGNYDVKISNVKSLKISSNVATYYNRANKITSCHIPDSVSILDPYCFYSCSRLSEVQGGNEIVSIGSYAFYSCRSLTTASFPNVTSIGSSAFYACSSLATASFPNATSIGYGAFYYCTSLTTASFPNVTSIGNNAFYGCTLLTTASFPQATSIYGCFGYCINLKSVYVENDILHSTDNGYGESRQIITDVNNTTVYAAVGGISQVTNSTVTSIRSSAFYFCSSLTTASFPNVTSIGSSAFYSCRSLTTASFPNVASIGSYAFYYCTSLATSSFPNATSIGLYAFYSCRSLTTASFPNATTIGASAFGHCSSLTTASFPNVASIGSSAFYSCRSLKSIYFLGSSVPTLANSNAFSNIHSECKIYVPSSLYTQYMSANNWIYVNSMLTSKTKEYSYEHEDIEFKLSDGMMISPAPSLVGSVVQVKTNSTTWNPAYSSFLPSSQASKIEEVVFNNEIQTSVGTYAFYSMQSLKKARDIYASIEQIGAYAFYSCRSLTTASFPNATMIGSYAFWYCTSLTTASFPNVTLIGNNAFYSCISLTTASFPNATSIGTYAFLLCSSLKSIYFLGSSVPTLANSDAFLNVYSSYSVYVPESLYSQYLSTNNWSLIASHITSYIQ